MPRDFLNFFVWNIEKRIVWCISAEENYYNLTKNGRKFQASVTERCTFLSKHSGIIIIIIQELQIRRQIYASMNRSCS